MGKKKNDLSPLSKLADRLQSAQGRSGQTIYKDGKYIGVGKGDSMDLVKGTRVHNNSKKAKAFERFEAEKLGKDVSDKNPAPDEVDEDKLRFYIEEFLNKDVFKE